MPAAARTTLEEIVVAGQDLLEAGGTGALTMAAVAARVGVRAPSLYKRVRGRDQLLALVAGATVEDLGDRLAEHGASGRARARARRSSASPMPSARSPTSVRSGYGLIFGPLPRGRPTGRATHSSAPSAPILQVCAALVGEHTGPGRRAHRDRLGQRLSHDGAVGRVPTRCRTSTGPSSTACTSWSGRCELRDRGARPDSGITCPLLVGRAGRTRTGGCVGGRLGREPVVGVDRRLPPRWAYSTVESLTDLARGAPGRSGRPAAPGDAALRRPR